MEVDGLHNFVADEIVVHNCCAAAFAERSGTRTHILCKDGLGGIPEAIVNHELLTEDEAAFERDFVEARRRPDDLRWYPNVPVQDRSPEATLPKWEEILLLPSGKVPEVSSTSRTGTVVKLYPSREGDQARRYWVDERVLVSGSVASPEDGVELRALGVTHVLSADEHSDEWSGIVADRRHRVCGERPDRFPDLGQSLDSIQAELVESAEFAARVLSDPAAVLCTKCRLGGSRGPTLGYLALRAGLGMTREEALLRVRLTRGDWAPHAEYLASVDRALGVWRGQRAGARALGEVVERYRVPAEPGAGGGPAIRWWLHPRVLVGGSILSEQDGLHLQHDFGVTHVLSVESERLDDGRGFAPDHCCRAAFPDDGRRIEPALLERVIEFADRVLRQEGTTLYCHCQLGGSRGPSLGYLIAHGLLGAPREQVLGAIRRVRAPLSPAEGPDLHRGYVLSIDDVLAEWWAGKDGTATALYQRFRESLLSLGELDATVTDYWRSRCAAQVQFARTLPTADFLRWSDDVSMRELPCFVPWYRALQEDAEWPRWERLSRCAPWGHPHDFSLDPGTSPVSLQHAYHLQRFEALTGCKLSDVDVVIELGGGYGNFCRMLRRDGFGGAYAIVDLPHQREFQRLYLSLEKLGPKDEVDVSSGAVSLLLEKDIPQLVQVIRGKRVAFVSTWGLSEVPLALREKLLPILKVADRYLFAAQWPRHSVDSIDNQVYFEGLMAEVGARWCVETVAHHEGSRYLFGVRGVAGDTRVVRSEAGQSVEQGFPIEHLAKNHEPMPEYFGQMLGLLRKNVVPGGSEFGLGLTLFSLCVSIRATNVLEIGRFKGFSTLALGSALRFLSECGWQEPQMAHQRPDVDYADFEDPDKKRQLWSVDPHPTPEAEALMDEAGLRPWVKFADSRSDDVRLEGQHLDLVFVDGSHEEADLCRDFEHFSPHVRVGGYLVLHDYYGWWTGPGNKVNGSPIKRVCDSLQNNPNFKQLLIDTGYASLVIFQKVGAQTYKQPKPASPRPDGQPTIGLVIIARNENPIVARAIASCPWVDCVTVVVGSESTDGTAEMCERLGAEVHLRPYAGSIAACRNEAMTIAEQRTDWMLLCDADDAIRGVRPNLRGVTVDAFNLMTYDHGGRYPRTLLLRSKCGMTFEGCSKKCNWQIRHEYLDAHGRPIGFCESVTYERMGHVSGVLGFQDQAGTRAKYLIHARDLYHHHIDHPEDARTVYYLGQSYRDAGEPRLAIEWFLKRANMSSGDEEAWWAQYQAAIVTENLGEDPTALYVKAFQMRPQRPEPLIALASWYRVKYNSHHIAYVYALAASQCPTLVADQFLFGSDHVQWRILEELGVNAFNSGHVDVAVDAMQRIQKIIPMEHQQWAKDVLAKVRVLSNGQS